MPEIILDTNFILNCVDDKVDFFEELQQRGFHVLIVDGVLKELEKIKKSNKKLRFRQNAEIALKIINHFIDERFVRKINIGKRGNVDKIIIKFLRKNPDVYLGTMDKIIKDNLLNRKVVLRARKKIEIL
jgi:rRNA-processing protein FCF1